MMALDDAAEPEAEQPSCCRACGKDLTAADPLYYATPANVWIPLFFCKSCWTESRMRHDELEKVREQKALQERKRRHQEILRQSLQSGVEEQG